MKKLFFAIYFTAFVLLPAKGHVAVSNIEEAAESVNTPRELAPVTSDNLPDPNNIEEVRAFFKKRFQTAIVSDASDLGDLNKSNSMDIQHSAEYIQNMKEQKKSAFEKIYDQTLARLNKPQAEFSADTIFYERQKVPEKMLKEDMNISVVRVRLPNGMTVLAPAREHIPYLLSSFHILPTGSVEVEEEVVVVANGEQLKNGLVKTMPKYTTSRSNVKKKLEVELLSVEINNKEVPYTLQEIGNNILFSPKEKYILEPGVYTYRFKYLLDRKLWYYDDFTEFYMDISGSYPTLVVTSANAIVSVPDGRNFMSQISMAGPINDLKTRRTIAVHLSQNALGFASLVPLGVGEGMHILVSLDRAIFNKPSIGKRFVWFISDEGDILFALLGFIVIFGAYFLSWRLIKQNKSLLSVHFKQTAALNRYILNGVYDKRSYISAFLDLIRYNVVDIKRENQTLTLIKKTDSLKHLPTGLKILMNTLFGKTDSSLDVNAKNKLKFERAFSKHEAYIKNAFKFLTLKLNVGYLFFSVAMLVLTLISISYIAINPLETMMILTASMLTFAFYLWILRRSFAIKWWSWVAKITAVMFVVLNVLLLSVYIHFLAALLLGSIVYVILEYSGRFSSQNGLIKGKSQQLEKLYQYLKTNALTIAISKEFELYQSNIFAFELENIYEENPKNKKIYKLTFAQDLFKTL